METRANYAIVGFFTVAVMLAAFGFVYWMQVYGREGQPCPGCGAPVRRIVQGTRATYFCGRCQKR